MAAASTLRRAVAAAVHHRTAAAAVHHRTAAVALLRPSATATIHPTSRLHRPLLGPGSSVGQRRLFSGQVVVEKVTPETAEKILAEMGRIDAAAVQRQGLINDEISALDTKVIAYTEAVSAKQYEKTVEVGQTSFKVSLMVLVAAGVLGSTTLYVVHKAGGAAVSEKAKKLVEDKTQDIKMRVEEMLLKILAEQEQANKAAMEARQAALKQREESLRAREEALKKQEPKGKIKGENKEVGVDTQRNAH